MSEENVEKVVKEKSIVREICEWVLCIFAAFALAMVVRYFVLTPTIVCQTSMTPTILDGERVIINRAVRTFKLPLYRGDIVTFERPIDTIDGKAQYNEVDGIKEFFFHDVMELSSLKTSYIKRVIGLPNDHVEIKNGKVYVNGNERNDVNLDGIETPITGKYHDIEVPEGYVFVMGDNRSGSTDSREFGCIPIEKIDGRVTLRIGPLEKFGKIDE